MEIFTNSSGFANCNEEDTQLYLIIDGNDSGFQIVNDDKTLPSVLEKNTELWNQWQDKDENPRQSGTSNEESLETVMCWYERTEECIPSQLFIFKRMLDLTERD